MLGELKPKGSQIRHEPLHWKSRRDPKAKMLSLQSFLRKGVSLGYVERIQNLKDLLLTTANTVLMAYCC